MLAKGKRRPCCYAVVPMDLYRALGANRKANAGWKNLSPDERRDLVDWVEEPESREKRAERVARALGTLSSGKRLPFL